MPRASTKPPLSELHQRVGANIRRLRIKNNITQEKLAFSLGTDRGYVSRTELGQQNMSIDQISNYAAALDVDPVSFFRKSRKNDA